MEQGQSAGYPSQSPAAPVDGAGFEPHAYEAPSPPPETGAPDAAPGPAQPEAQPEITTQLTAAEQRAQQAELEAQQLRQAFGEIQGMFARAEAERQEQELRSQAQSRLEQAYTVAADMDPESALTYVRRVHEAEQANLLRQMQENEVRAQQRLEQTVAQIAVPQYARVKGQELGLPDKYVERLAGVPAHLIDALLPFVQEFAQQETSFQSQLEQLGRSTRAGEMAASGAFNPSGNGAVPARPETSKFDPNSPDYDKRAFLANILERAGVLRSPR